MPATVSPAYLGPLYTCYHPPRSAARRAVLICQPHGHEHVRCHRALRLLADRLAGAGCAALRFDGYGVGDSAGDHHEATLERWVDDARAAAAALRDRTGLPVDLVGLRLGATIAALAGDPHDTGRVVLWDPIVDGAAYWRSLVEGHAAVRAWIEQEYGAPPDDPTPEGEEIVGTLWSPRLIRDITSLDLTRLAAPPAREALLVGSDAACLGDRLASLGVRAQTTGAGTDQVWLMEPSKAAMPVQTIARIVEWLAAPAAGEDW